jgi:UPF0176 protein
MEYQILAYYQFVSLDDPQAVADSHRQFFEGKDVKGRVYFSPQGVNGGLSGSSIEMDRYIAWLRQDPRFQSVQFKVHRHHEHAFPRLSLKVREQLVAIDLPVDFSQKGQYLSPQEWKQKLETEQQELVVLDVRNDYESKLGHFKGAHLPPLESFRQFPAYADQLKKDYNPETTQVMMYCTGGIRCELYSSVLKQAGFKTVYQLEGGILAYGEQVGSDHWEGQLFVFDDRLSVPIAEDSKSPIAQCIHCHTTIDLYFNCANVDCNELFLACWDCIEKKRGCCCDECQTAPRIRTIERLDRPKPFRKLSQLSEEFLESPAE